MKKKQTKVKRDMKKINATGLKKIYDTLKKQPHLVIGSYEFKGFRIQVSRFGLSTNERVSQLYHKRRNNGLCIRCGVKVKRKNPKNGKLYRLCDKHRKEIDKV